MRYIIAILTILLVSCSKPLKKVMQSNHPAISKVKDSIDQYEVQILYSQIDTLDTGEISFKEYAFNVDKNRYFYPASSIKLPMAILAAEYADLNEQLSLDIPYITKRDAFKHSIADDIAAIFAISDNEAYNRLYEILGRDYANDRLREKGLAPTRISHRLSTPEADNNKRATVKFFPGYSAETIILTNTSDKPIKPLKLKGITKGTGVQNNGQLQEISMDFSEKNYFPLETQHELMKRIIFPQHYKPNQRFDISEDTRKRLLTMMKTTPGDAGYTSDEYYDSYVKFFMFGDQKTPIPEHISIYNKVGYAYGTLTETAYIVDYKEGVQFLLSATILVNKNGVFNDDTYEYEEIGIPFLAQLGREIHQIEIERKEYK